MAIIYRVENDDHNGVYSTNTHAKIGLSGSSEDRHPAPWADAILEPYFTRAEWGGWTTTKGEPHKWNKKGYLRFGFSSLDQTKFWFFRRSWRDKLERLGFHVAVYDAPDVIAGETQAVFDVSTATVIKTIKLTELTKGGSDAL